MMTYMLIAVDRFRMLDDPGKPRIPAFVCALGTWFFAVCIVLPYPIYTTYIDLEVKFAFKNHQLDHQNDTLRCILLNYFGLN